MSAAQKLLAQGFAQTLSQLGESVTFGATTIRAVVVARDAEMDLVEGGWRKGSTFVVEVPVGALASPPQPKAAIGLRGVTATIRTVTPPHPARPAWNCIVET